MGDTLSCVEPPKPLGPTKYDFLAPFNVMKTPSLYDWKTCPFCNIKRQEAKQLLAKIEQLSGELDGLRMAIPLCMTKKMDKFVCKFKWTNRKQEYVENFAVSVCAKCLTFNEEIQAMRDEVKYLERTVMGTIAFTAATADQLEQLLIEKRGVECRAAAKENIPIVTRVR
eukprot:GEMP01064974.1.p2 GENE.GEMP01064974.1~~GEMP01064974.1.p2  ORF type:complete len:169 (+),score=40.52 GEMP01064974.1:749-1255(+)